MSIGKNKVNFLNNAYENNLNPQEQIEELIKKFRIKNEDNQFIDTNETHIEDIANYITEFKYKNINIPRELTELFRENHFFVEELNKYLEEKLINLTNSDSTYFYKDITTMFNIFCVEIDCKLFESYDKYNFDELSRLFRHIESDLISINRIGNTKLFELKFDTYVIVLKALTQLCIINSTDILKVENTKFFSELITESLNTLKYNIELNEDKLRVLNHIQGTLLYYFVDVDSLKVKKKSLEENIQSYLYLIERIQDGYLLSKHYNFGQQEPLEKIEENEIRIFNSNFCIVILDLLTKVQKKNISLEEINNIDSFKRILKLYSENFNYTFEIKYELSSIKEFKNILLDSLVYASQEQSDLNKIMNHSVMINNVIFADKNYDRNNLKIIYSILLYSDNVSDFIYLNIGQILSKTSKLKNDYHEFYKLRILDLVVNHYIKVGTQFESKNLLQDILEYVEENIISSHLFSVYSKIYLSIALLYSKDIATVKKAKELYATYIETNNLDLLNTYYKSTNEKILNNIAKNYFNELHLIDEDLSEEKLNKLGEYVVKEYNEKRLVQAKFEMVQGLVEVSSELLSNPLTQFENIQAKIDHIIEKSIFHGLCKVLIIGLEKETNRNSDAGYKNYLIELKNDYAIKFIFPATLENSFLKVLKMHKDTIVFNTDNILSILKLNDKQLIDPVTNLYNVSKLNIMIQNFKEEKLGFIEIFIDELPQYNQKYGFEFGNKVLKLATERIREVCVNERGVFKLSGTKIGILVSKKDNYQHLVDNLTQINTNIDDVQINLNPYVIYTIDRKSKLLISSSKGIDRAMLFGEKKYINI